MARAIKVWSFISKLYPLLPVFHSYSEASFLTHLASPDSEAEQLLCSFNFFGFDFLWLHLFLVKNWSSGNSCLPSRFWWTLRKALRYLNSSLILALINPSGWLPNSPVHEHLVGPSSCLWDGESTERWMLCSTESRMRACECLRCGGPKPVDRGAYVNRSCAWCIALRGSSVI